jgi:hypothetical protein
MGLLNGWEDDNWGDDDGHRGGFFRRLFGRDRPDVGRDVGPTSRVVTNWWPGRNWDPRDGDPRAGSSWDRSRPWEGGW